MAQKIISNLNFLVPCYSTQGTEMKMMEDYSVMMEDGFLVRLTLKIYKIWIVDL